MSVRSGWREEIGILRRSEEDFLTLKFLVVGKELIYTGNLENIILAGECLRWPKD